MRATNSDLKDVVGLLLEDELGQNREMAITDQVPNCYLEAFEKITATNNNQLIVMEHNGEIIGTLQLIIIPTLTLQGIIRAEVEGVRIKAKYRNHGLGRFLFQWVKQTAKEKGCGLIQLTTNKSRISAQKFYNQLGFIDSHCGMKLYL